LRFVREDTKECALTTLVSQATCLPEISNVRAGDRFSDRRLEANNRSEAKLTIMQTKSQLAIVKQLSKKYLTIQIISANHLL
jgi:hypothetical protein